MYFWSTLGPDNFPGRSFTSWPVCLSYVKCFVVHQNYVGIY